MEMPTDNFKSNKFIDDLQKYMFISKENARNILMLFEYVLLKNQDEYKQPTFKLVNLQIKKENNTLVIGYDKDMIEELQNEVQEHFIERE